MRNSSNIHQPGQAMTLRADTRFLLRATHVRSWGLVLLCSLVPFREVTAQEPAAAEGQALFEGRCVACHTTGTDRLVGPGLQGVTERRDRSWLIDLITDPDGMIARGDSLATALLAEYEVPMPNFGLSREQASSILAYLAGAEAGPAAATPLPAGDPVSGQELFSGRRPLDNGGAACMACHDVAGLGALGGGTLGRELTHAATRYGDGLPGILRSPPFAAMRAVLAEHPLTAQEVADLTAFLLEVDRAPELARSGWTFPAAGAGGAILLMILVGTTWRNRLRGVRKPLIGGRR